MGFTYFKVLWRWFVVVWGVLEWFGVFQWTRQWMDGFMDGCLDRSVKFYRSIFRDYKLISE